MFTVSEQKVTTLKLLKVDLSPNLLDWIRPESDCRLLKLETKDLNLK